MAWSTFFGVVVGAYAMYYVINFLYDLFLSRKPMAPADACVYYDLEELAREEEQGYGWSEEGENEDQYDDEGEPYAQEELNRMPETAPALRVEGQGIPLEEFLKEAKTYSSSIF